MDSQTQQILQRAAQYIDAQHQQAYLVGGSLRDMLLGESSYDWDIVLEGDAHRTARSLADILGGHYAHMHEKASRVIIKRDPHDVTLDIAPLHGKSIEEDLGERDFTINALAIPLNDALQLFEKKHNPSRLLIDPTSGFQDIQKRELRVVGDSVFRHDPLRMLRAIRLMTRSHLDLPGDTRALIKRDTALLPSVASERVHDELYAILEPDNATARLHLLDELGLLTILIPELIPARGMRQPVPHYWDVLEHSLQIVRALELVAHLLQGAQFTESVTPRGRLTHLVYDAQAHPIPDTFAYLIPNEATSASFSEICTLVREAEKQGIFSPGELTAPRMKMAALLHDIGKPATYITGEDGSVRFYNHPQVGARLAFQITRRLNASTRDRRLAQLVAAHHMRPGQLGQDGAVTPRAIRRFFVDLGPTGILVALFSLADHLATSGPQSLTDAWERHLSVVALLLARYIRQRDSIIPPRLLSPEELMRRLKLEPGPLVGQLLETIAEAQSDGTIHSKEEALWLAEEQLSILREDA